MVDATQILFSSNIALELIIVEFLSMLDFSWQLPYSSKIIVLCRRLYGQLSLNTEELPPL